MPLPRMSLCASALRTAALALLALVATTGPGAAGIAELEAASGAALAGEGR